MCKEDADKFLNSNHLQGKSASKVRLGLYHNDELVSLMTFGKFRFNKNVEWELVRFCSKSGCNVVGGASKLFKYFVNTYKPKSIITYSNNNLGNGSVYKGLGFSEFKNKKPASVWVNLKTKDSIRHTSLVMQGADRLLCNKVKNYFKVGLDREDFILRGGKEEYREEYSNLPENTDWWPGNIDIIKHYGFVQVYDCGSTKWEYIPK